MIENNDFKIAPLQLVVAHSIHWQLWRIVIKIKIVSFLTSCPNLIHLPIYAFVGNRNLSQGFIWTSSMESEHLITFRKKPSRRSAPMLCETAGIGVLVHELWKLSDWVRIDGNMSEWFPSSLWLFFYYLMQPCATICVCYHIFSHNQR